MRCFASWSNWYWCIDHKMVWKAELGLAACLNQHTLLTHNDDQDVTCGNQEENWQSPVLPAQNLAKTESETVSHCGVPRSERCISWSCGQHNHRSWHVTTALLPATTRLQPLSYRGFWFVWCYCKHTNKHTMFTAIYLTLLLQLLKTQDSSKLYTFSLTISYHSLLQISQMESIVT